MVNYGLIAYIYSGFLLLLLIALFDDRFNPTNKTLKTCNWSLWLAGIMLFISLSGEVVRSLWHVKLIPFAELFPYNYQNWEIFTFFYLTFLLILIYIFLHVIYEVSIIETFGLKLSQISFVLKLCGTLTIVNILSIYILDLNLLLNLKNLELEYLSSMDTKHLILFSFVTIILSPVVEESIFRGLIYSPLYRKVGRGFAIILSSLLWTQSHFESLPVSIGIFIVGIFLAWLYDRSGSLVHPLVFHIFRNSWILAYFPSLRS